MQFEDDNIHTNGKEIWDHCVFSFEYTYMTQLLLLGKVEYGGGPIFKMVLEC